MQLDMITYLRQEGASIFAFVCSFCKLTISTFCLICLVLASYGLLELFHARVIRAECRAKHHRVHMKTRHTFRRCRRIKLKHVHQQANELTVITNVVFVVLRPSSSTQLCKALLPVVRLTLCGRCGGIVATGALLYMPQHCSTRHNMRMAAVCAPAICF